MTQARPLRTLIATGALSAVAVAGVATASTASASHDNLRTAQLNSLNSSGVTGVATVRAGGGFANARVQVHGAAPGLPHAQHIHYGEQALHECPTIQDDANDDFRLNVAEGVPSYGGIAVSLTNTGNTAAASGLAVDRMPVADADGSYLSYRTGIRLTPAGESSAAEVQRAILAGEGVVVIHGVDYNGNGRYDFDSAGASELDASLPAEATDPAACGVLRH